MNSAPTHGLEPYKKEDLQFQRTCQMLHNSNARVCKLKHCGNQTLWVESALVAQCTGYMGEHLPEKTLRQKKTGNKLIWLDLFRIQF